MSFSGSPKRGRHECEPQIATESDGVLAATIRFLRPPLPIESLAAIHRHRCAPGRCASAARQAIAGHPVDRHWEPAEFRGG